MVGPAKPSNQLALLVRPEEPIYAHAEPTNLKDFSGNSRQFA
jgi:hypothetical protein